MMISTIDQVIKEKKGILLIDKPKGWTSHDVVGKIRKITGVKKVGHAGTLDPLATGLLILLVGREFTKMQSQFLKQDKQYSVTGVLGKTTDSYDADGSITSQADWTEVSKINREKLNKVLPLFIGEITQQVPVFSAVKVSGEKLYEKARSGKISETFTLPSRQVNIHQLELLNFLQDNEQHLATFSLRVKVSSGTYIRSLVHDIGQKLKIGAYVNELRRETIGDFSVQDAEKIVNEPANLA